MSRSRALGYTILGMWLGGQTLGCALTSKSDSVVLRYFSPEPTRTRTSSADVGPRAAPVPGVSLRLGRVNAASYLKDKIAFRDSAYEVGYYDELRWTEKPEAYLRRSLRSALFEDQHLRQAVSGGGPTLDVELNAFEEIKSPRHAGRVGVTWILRDDMAVMAQETFVVERPFTSGTSGKSADETPAAFTAAMSEALDEAVKRVASRVLLTIAPTPASSAAAADATPPPASVSR